MSTITDTKAVQEIAQRLYRAMPGAVMPPKDDERYYLWGEVEETDEYAFCETIAREILAASRRA